MRTALISALVLGLSGAAAAQPAPPPAVSRTMLETVDLPGDVHATAMARVTVVAGGKVPRHIHPGVEMAYVVEGAGTLKVDGLADRLLKAGDAFQVAVGVPHSLDNGPAPMTLVVIYVTEKGKPLSTPVAKPAADGHAH